MNRWLDEGVFMLSGKDSKLSITFVLGISPNSALYPISGFLRDRHQPKSKSVSKILPRVRRVPTIITLSLFNGFEHTSNDWKVAKVSYEFDIGSFLRLCLDWTQKGKILRLLKSTQHGNSSRPADFKIA
jgi:hypothetical protein